MTEGHEPRTPVLPMSIALRASQALGLWHDVMLDLVRDGAPDLSARQTVILLTVYLEPPPHTVRGLAKKLGVTKPAITRALDTMGKRQLLTRRRDENDRRNVIIQRTVEGALYVERLGDSVIARAKNLPA
jgi:DNA-binding MarR family transcriptional regulator